MLPILSYSTEDRTIVRDATPSIVVDEHLLYVAKPWLLSEKQLSGIIGRYTLPWYFLMLCSEATDSELQSKKMVDLVLGSTCVVIGIYDGESYLVWKAPN